VSGWKVGREGAQKGDDRDPAVGDYGSGGHVRKEEGVAAGIPGRNHQQAKVKKKVSFDPSVI